MSIFILVFIILGIRHVIRKLRVGTRRDIKELKKIGSEYWSVREMCRYRMMNPQEHFSFSDVYQRLGSTRLASTFPDTMEDRDRTAYELRKMLYNLTCFLIF